MMKKNEAASWSYADPSKIIRTPLSYRGTFHRNLNASLETSRDDFEDDVRSSTFHSSSSMMMMMPTMSTANMSGSGLRYQHAMGSATRRQKGKSA